MRERLGPYRLGGQLVATCVNNGGSPAPRLSWWRDGSPIDLSYEEVNGQTINALQLDNITRADQSAVFQCRSEIKFSQSNQKTSFQSGKQQHQPAGCHRGSASDCL